MKNSARWMALGLAALLLNSPTAAGDGWAWSKLNPFAKSTTSTRATKSSSAKSWTPQLPKLPKLPRLKSPPTIQKVSRSTTRMAARTWDTITFWDNGKQPNKWEGGAKPYKRKQAKSQSWFGPLFGNKETKPKTPGEFLSLKRPE